MPGQLRITLVRSSIGRPDKHERILRALGLKKRGRSVLRQDTPSIRGMVGKVSHLVVVEEIP